MSMRALRSIVVVVLVAVSSAACGAGASEGPAGAAVPGPRSPSLAPGPAPSAYQVMQPTPAADLQVPLDSEGRPYDAPVADGVTVHTARYATLHVADGELRILDGNALEVFPSESEATAVSFPGHDTLDVDIVWETFPNATEDQVLGVFVRVPGSRPVARWSAYRPAYGTDGGVGGITSAAVTQRADRDGFDRWEPPDVDYESTLQLFDLDGQAGDDSLIFSNGYGDGGFPMSVGRDAGGRLAGVMIWDPRYPWRLAVPDGTPPPDVTEREEQMAHCMSGTRAIQVYGDRKYCT